MSSFGCILRDRENIFIDNKDIIYFLLAVNLLETPKACLKCSCKKLLLCQNDYFSDHYSWNCSRDHASSIRKNSPFEDSAVPLKLFINLVYFWAIGSNMARCVEYLEIDDSIGEEVMGIVNQVCHRALIRDPVILGGNDVIVAAKIIPIGYYIQVLNSDNEEKFKFVQCYLLCLLDFYQEDSLVHLSILHSDEAENVLVNVYRFTLPGTIIHIDDDMTYNQTQYNKIKYKTNRNSPNRKFGPLTTKDVIIIGEFITQYISKNTNMDYYLKYQLYTYIEHVMFRYKSAAKRPSPRTLFEDFLIEYQSQFCNVPNRYLYTLNENEI